MQERFFRWVDKSVNRKNVIIKLFNGLNWLTKDWVHAFVQTLLACWLQFTVDNYYLFIFVCVLIAVSSWWYSLVNSYHNYKNAIFTNAASIQAGINDLIVSLDGYMKKYSNGDGIFEYACELVSNSLYKVLKQATGCEVRVSVVQQFVDDDRKSCVLLGRKSRMRSTSRKTQRQVKYVRGQDYYYQKILLDNKDAVIVFNEGQVNRNFYFRNLDLKSNIYQYVGITDMNGGKDVLFVIQLDALDGKKFIKKSDDHYEIREFYNNFIYPYICFLRHAYNIEESMRRR